MKIILVRYGSWKDQHLTVSGVEQMQIAAASIKTQIGSDDALVISAAIPRAIEGAQIIATALSLNSPHSYHELYAADEAGLQADAHRAAILLEKLGESHGTIVAIVSREYIEQLPTHLIRLSSGVSLERGECVVINTTENTLQILRRT